jgi:pimeloyl-ACP methyl ester carboxylesterase
LHGFGGSTYSYRHIAPAFQQTNRVIAVDLKGFGYSERDDRTGLSATDQVAMLHAFLDRCAVRRAVIIGHSMGGAIAMRFAASHPEIVSALVLAASAAGDERAGARAGGLPRWLLRPVLPVLAGLASRRLLGLMYHDRSRIAPDVRDEYLKPARIKGSMDGLLAMMRDRASDPPIDFGAITMPVLLLAGAHDEVVPLATAQRLRDRLPRARLVVVEGAAHGLLEERAEECVRLVRDFLAEVEPARASSAAPGASA